MLPFKLLRRQTEATIRNRAAGAESNLRRKTSVAGAASRLTAEASRKGETAVKNAWKKRREDHTGSVPIEETAAENRPAAPVFTADGYRRKTPVQSIYEPPDYRRKLVLRVACSLLAVTVLAILIYCLLHSGILSR